MRVPPAILWSRARTFLLYAIGWVEAGINRSAADQEGEVNVHGEGPLVRFLLEYRPRG